MVYMAYALFYYIRAIFSRPLHLCLQSMAATFPFACFFFLFSAFPSPLIPVTTEALAFPSCPWLALDFHDMLFY